MGRAIVDRCLRDGLSVLATDRSQEKLDSLADKHSGLRTVQAELNSNDLLERIENALVEEEADGSRCPVSGLVNLAGISLGDTIENISDEDWSH